MRARMPSLCCSDEANAAQREEADPTRRGKLHTLAARHAPRTVLHSDRAKAREPRQRRRPALNLPVVRIEPKRCARGRRDCSRGHNAEWARHQRRRGWSTPPPRLQTRHLGRELSNSAFSSHTNRGKEKCFLTPSTTDARRRAPSAAAASGLYLAVCDAAPARTPSAHRPVPAALRPTRHED